VGAALVVLQRAPRSAARGPLDPTRAPADASACTRLLELVAPSDINIVLLGETGVGKSFAAADVHRRSRRVGRPFVKLNCAALPEQLLESELFGHERGAFTGAVRSKGGLLEHADGGTVFLDEIANMPLAMQAKLLMAIEDKAVLRIGSLTPRSIDVRFISATNADLSGLVEAGRFRRDLYFRLNGVSATIPPLRERTWVIPDLARAFVKEACEREGRPLLEISSAALERLAQCPWPGNVRELRASVDLAVVLCPGPTILPEHLGGAAACVPAPDANPRRSEDARLKDELQKLERRRVLEALEKAGGNQTRAARLLGISRHALIHRMTSYDLPRPRKPSPSE
jgi:transcriptional regulator with PAS, ATPase and Fis domain